MNQLKVTDESLFTTSSTIDVTDDPSNGKNPSSILHFLQEVFRAYKDQRKL
jgi:hypothetical protein